jgi:peptide/nickel transport system permease protein
LAIEITGGAMTAAVLPHVPAAKRRLRRFVARNLPFLLSSAVLALLLIGSVLPTDWLPYDPHDPSLPSRFLKPWSEDRSGDFHILGADFLGRDMLSRLLFSGRYSLVLALGAALITTVAAVGFGISAGYRGGWYDTLVMRVVDGLLSLPVLLIAIVLAAIVGRGVGALAVILALTGWADYTRVIRAEALTLRDLAFVDASRTAGASTFRILLRDVLPNVVSTMSVMSTYLVARFMLLESSISFLGMGVVPPASSWGVMVGEGREYIFDAPFVSVIPGLLITVTVIAVNFVGDGLRDLLDPRGRRL